MTYKVYSLNMGHGAGQQSPSAQHCQPMVGVDCVTMMCKITYIIYKPTHDDRLI